MTSQGIVEMLQHSISIVEDLHPDDEKTRRSALRITKQLFSTSFSFKELLSRLSLLKYVAEVSDIPLKELILMALHFASSKLIKSIILEAGMDSGLFNLQEVIILEKFLEISELGYSKIEYHNFCGGKFSKINL